MWMKINAADPFEQLHRHVGRKLAIRVVFPAILTVFLFVISFTNITLPSIKSSLMGARKAQLKEQVQLVLSILQKYQKEEKSRHLSPEQSRHQAKELIRSLRYGPDNDEYFFIVDTNIQSIMHPFRQSLEGQDMSNILDSDGKPFIRHMAQIALTHGEGYIEFMWYKKEDPRIRLPKLGYVYHYQPWGWIIGSGLLINDIHQEISSLTYKTVKRYLLILLTLILVLVLLVIDGMHRERIRSNTSRALRNSQLQLESVFKVAPTGIGLVQNGILIEANDYICQMLGLSRQDIIGKPIVSFYPQNNDEGFWQNCLESDNQTFLKEAKSVQWQSASGQLIDVLLAVSLLNQSNPTDGISFTVRDVSALKRAENDREALQKQLIQAQKMEAVGRLAGGVAHDFNNMLGVILGHVELAQLSMQAEHPAYDHLKEIASAANRSAELTNQILAFARKQTIQPQVLDLNRAVEKTLRMIRRLIGEDIDLLWIPSPDLWPIEIDPSQLDQILTNLAVNARKAIAGTGKVTIETGNISFDEAYCHEHAGFMAGDFGMLAVSDSGIGMDEETISHLFEPFFTTREPGQGTGLGLATIYGIVKQNNGFITVYSEKGIGSSFRLYFPRCTQKTENVEVDMEIPPAIGHETILIVEDEGTVLNLCKTILLRLGYKILTAKTPQNALDITRHYQEQIDLLITDTIMPGMNGWDLSAEIKKVRPDIRVLFMSGYTSNVIANHGILEGDVNFLQKPFHIEILASKVRGVLDMM